MKYRAFLSYSHTDRKWARWLHRELESYRPPKHLGDVAGHDMPQRLSPIFRDRVELPSSASLSEAVNEALAESEALIVVCSPAAAASRWVGEEIRVFRRLGRTDQIFCFIVDGEPTGDQADCFPKALTESDDVAEFQWEPVAADARPTGDGRRDAILKIAAGMLGVGFDELKQRDVRRNQRRLVGVAVASILVAAVTITLAVTATMARNEANVRRQQAENLIDFMLGDLQDQLREIGRLDLYQSIGDKAMDYFSVLDQENESDASLSQRAKNLRHIGEVRQEQGNLSAASEAFFESTRIMEELVGRTRANPETQLGLANSYYYVGLVDWQRGNLQQARQQFERVLPIVDALRAAEPENTEWLIESGYAYTNLGRVQELEGLLVDALNTYQEVMRFNQRLIELEPDNPEWTLELGFANNNLGKVVTSLGQLDDAESYYRQDVAIKTQLMKENPDHNIWHSYKAVSEYFLGRLLANGKQVEEGITYLDSALASFLDLTRQDPEQTVYRARLANIERDLGEVLFLQGQLERAAALIASSKNHFEELLLIDNSHTPWRRGVASTLLVAAAMRSSHSDVLAAQKSLGEANVHIANLLEQEPSSRESQQLAIRKDLLTAHLRFVDDQNAARTATSAAIDRMEEFFSGTADPWVLELKADGLTLLGRTNEAAGIRAKLQNMGFRETSALMTGM